MFCVGVIGNFAGHLSGAEKIEEDSLPSGLFVIHNDEPNTISSSKKINYPRKGSKVDIEPEFVMRCKVGYENGLVSTLMATEVTVGNDLTIRELEGSTKISQRKSWGLKSKGINAHWWDVLKLSPTSHGHNLKLISYIEREGEIHLATPAVDCTELKVFYFHLMTWLADRINFQPNEGIFEEILPELERHGYPTEILIFTGAPNYTDWGEVNFIKPGDHIHISAFKTDIVKETDIEIMFANKQLINNDNIISFSQQVEC